ncbi:hypothetical protein Y032_0636g934 [Ancylostoma ceylanicum]|uniref:Uncharacterized protein n=1 Tax=Ancylostoma ceylanicum TaxID=53326 RepID=A0A016WKW9_9BILA|nr:hypothetical protein Y032_0636g934 [Ancylostoma ceylanicum]
MFLLILSPDWAEQGREIKCALSKRTFFENSYALREFMIHSLNGWEMRSIYDQQRNHTKPRRPAPLWARP